MKRLFQVVLIGSNLVPLGTGVLAALTGAALFVSAEEITTDFNAQVRVYGIWFTAIFFLSVWMAFNIDKCGPVLKIVFSLVALAGASRLYTMFAAGEYPVTTFVGAIVEFATLLFIPWHQYILTKMESRTSAGQASVIGE